MWLKEGRNYYPSYACSQSVPGSLSMSSRFCPRAHSHWKMGEDILECYTKVSLYRWAKNSIMYLNYVSIYELQRLSDKAER